MKNQDRFSTGQAAAVFGVVEQTIRNWSKEFKAYMSPTATIGGGRTRYFTIEDMRIFALVAQMTEDGYHYDDVLLSLANGQQGDLPAVLVPPETALALRSSETYQKLERITQQLMEITQQRDEALATMRQLENRNILLEEQLRAKNQRAEELAGEVQKQDTKIEDLLRELARLNQEIGNSYSKGLLEGIQQGLKITGSSKKGEEGEA